MKLKLIGLLVLAFAIIGMALIIKYQGQQINLWKNQYQACSATVENMNKQVIAVNEVNQANNEIINKYNAMKKREYQDEKDSDLNALHNLDVLLEQKSIID